MADPNDQTRTHEAPGTSTEKAEGDRERGHGHFPLRRLGVRFGDRLLKIRIGPRKELESKNFFCKFCFNGYFHTERQLHSHLLLHASELAQEQRKECERCGIWRSAGIQVFDLRYYAAHLKTHVLAECFECPKCGRAYGRVSELREHAQHCRVDEEKPENKESKPPAEAAETNERTHES
ncbi:hypothetical protein M3Y99_00190300 [Aphelenchoides fujianensis]|nr:hypothetical protein M3Y99_00190300 [Aphelenchoides fujianensis]